MSEKVEATMAYEARRLGIPDHDHYQPTDELLAYVALRGVSFRVAVEINGIVWRWVAVSRGTASQRSGIWYTVTLGYWSPRLGTPHHHQFMFSAEEIDTPRWWSF